MLTPCLLPIQFLKLLKLQLEFGNILTIVVVLKRSGLTSYEHYTY